MYWILALLLLGIAAFCVAWPLVRRAAAARSAGPVPDAEASSATVRAVYQDRLTELRAEIAAGRIDPAIQEQVMEELRAALLDDYRELEAAGAGRHAAARGTGGAGRLGWVLACLLPLGGLGVYWIIGEPSAGTVVGAAAVLQLDPDRDRAEIEAWRERLTRRVAREPADAQSWYLLGSTGLQLGEFADAADAFSRAHAITGPDPVIDVYWLQSRYLAQGGALDPLSREIAERILARRENHPLVLELFAIDAFRRGEYADTVAYLNRALTNDLAPQQAQSLLAGLEQAQSRLEPQLPTVAIEISAADGAPADAVLFVIARPPGGGMPYAVVRRPAGVLPLTVRLDDRVSMNPELPLSRAPAFEVVVRLSRSGTAAPHPGDWEWRSAPLAADQLAAPVNLVARLEAPAESRAPAAASGT
ncbi:MAG: c-type cytochrome biogenesis protein CcmI [Pseudomonadales bacterium]|nr:c-type cytochrome biogenesis protein CcmI [Pseudomonadales bacterium]